MILLQEGKKHCAEEKWSQLENQLDTNRPELPPGSAVDGIITVQCCYPGTEISVKLL